MKGTIHRTFYVGLLTFFVLLFSNSLYSQKNIDSYFRNDSIKFQITRTTKPISKSNETPVLFYYLIVDMPKSIRKFLSKKDSLFWIGKLNSETTDWATTVLLYYIYEKDASFLVLNNTREKWLPFKKSEISYWQAFLTE